MPERRARGPIGLGILGFALFLITAGCAETDLGECILDGEEFVSQTTRGDCADRGGQFTPLGERSLVAPM